MSGTQRACLSLLIVLAFASTAAAQEGLPPDTRQVTVDGFAIRVHLSGLDSRRPGQPVVVFEAGATNSLDVWANVLPAVAAHAPVVAYDRAGLGQSAWDGQAPTPRHVTGRLHRTLDALAVPPPYLLVGHSWGGSLIRYFAGYYPTDVAGIVYVDPSPIVTQSVADELAPFTAIGAGQAGHDALWSRFVSFFVDAPPAVHAEFDVLRELMKRDPAERDLRPAPAVPVAVLVAAKPYPPLPDLPFDAATHFEADLRHRIGKLQEWALAAPQGELVVSNHTSHAIPREAPDLIIWAIQRVLDAAQR